MLAVKQSSNLFRHPQNDLPKISL